MMGNRAYATPQTQAAPTGRGQMRARALLALAFALLIAVAGSLLTAQQAHAWTVSSSYTSLSSVKIDSDIVINGDLVIRAENFSTNNDAAFGFFDEYGNDTYDSGVAVGEILLDGVAMWEEPKPSDWFSVRFPNAGYYVENGADRAVDLIVTVSNVGIANVNNYSTSNIYPCMLLNNIEAQYNYDANGDIQGIVNPNRTMTQIETNPGYLYMENWACQDKAVGLWATITYQIVKAGTSEPAGSTYTFCARDIDMPSLESGLADPYTGSYNESIRLLSGFDSKVYVSSGTTLDWSVRTSDNTIKFQGSEQVAPGDIDKAAFVVASDPTASFNWCGACVGTRLFDDFYHKITATWEGNGEVDPAGTTLVARGKSQLYLAVAATGHSATDLLIDGVSVGAPSTFLIAGAYKYQFTKVQADHTIHFVFKPNIYKITLDKQGGSGGSDAFWEQYSVKFSSNSSASNSISSITRPSRTGYTFGGYYTGTGGSGQQVVDANGNIKVGNTYWTSNATVYAKWTPITYTLRYHENFLPGNLTSDKTVDQTVTYDKAFTIGSHSWSHTGYTMSTSWYTGSSGTGTAYGNGQSVSSNLASTQGQVVHLYRNWSPNIYKITLDKQGGSGGSDAFWEVYNTRFSSNSSGSDSISSITRPSRGSVTSGGVTYSYTFMGYYTGTGGSGQQVVDANGNIKVGNTYWTSNATVYAYWKESSVKNPANFTVRHFYMDVNGNYPSSPASGDTETKTGTANDPVTISSYARSATTSHNAYEKVVVNGTQTTATTTTVLADGSRVIDFYYPRKQFYLDLNGLLDGTAGGNITGYGTAVVYVNNVNVSNGAVTDYCAPHYYGSTYSIKSITKDAGRTYEGVSQGSADGTITAATTVQLKYRSNKLVVNYYSNGATEAYSGTLNPVSASTNVIVRIWESDYRYTDTDNHYNYAESGASTYLGKTGYTATGYWIDMNNGTKVQQDTNWAGAAGCASAHGYDLSKGDVTINVKAEWTPNAPSNYTDTISHWMWGFQNQEGNNDPKTAFHIKNSTWTQAGGSSFVLDANDAVDFDGNGTIDIPNGYALRSEFGTSAISGTWDEYPMGTTVSQASGDMRFEYDYDPITYSITYDYGVGSAPASNPASYNVLYGVSFKDPVTPAGYNFDGYYIMGASKTMTLAASSHNWNYQAALTGVTPGQSYLVKIGSATRTAGSATQFKARLYDFTTNSSLVDKTFSFGSNLSFTLDCPNDSSLAGHDIQILLYAGVDGSTANNAVTFSNIEIGTKASGINVGKNASFTSQGASAMYTELASRTTGNKKVVASYTDGYQVAYNKNANDASGNMSNQSFRYDKAQNLTTTGFSRSGYTFTGWNTLANGSKSSVTLTNIAPSYSENDSTHAKYGTSSLKLTGTTSTPEVTYGIGNVSLDSTHKYYIRYEHYQETASGSFGLYWPIAEPSFVEGQSAGTAGKWNVCSAVNTRSNWSSGSHSMRVDYNNGYVAGSAWIDGLVVVDLTAAFGAGNEPNAAWCDVNIPYFTGTTTIKTAFTDQESVKNLTTAVGGTVTMYAQWKQNSYRVDYDGNGATSGSTASSTHYPDVAKNLTANGFSRSGYKFTGWRILPDGYTLLEYAQSSGSQWIDTGVSIGANTWVDADLMFNSAFDWNMMFGAWGDLSLSLKGSNAVCVAVGNTNSQDVGSSTTTGVKYNVKLGPGYGYTQDGVKYAIGGSANQGSGRHILLFAASDGSTGNSPYAWGSYGVGRIYGFRIYDGTTLLRDLVPAKNSSGVVGMYDMLNKQFYTNQGSGSLTAGPEAKNNFDNQESVVNLTKANGGVVTMYAQWEVNTFYLDVNGLLDNKAEGNTSGYGTFDVYINGSVVADDVADYWTPHPVGTTYAIKDVRPLTGHTYDGVSSGSISGTITAETAVQLKFHTNTYTVKYNANGGFGTTANSDHTYDVAKNLTANGFSRSGYEFAGWSLLPDGYSRLEYIQTDGNQWIDTGYVYKSLPTVDIDYATTSHKNSEIFGWGGKVSNGYLVNDDIGYNTRIDFWNGSGWSYAQSLRFDVSSRNTLRLTTTDGNIVAIQNGYCVAHIAHSGVSSNTSTALLFNGRGSTTYAHIGKLYGATMYDGNTVVRDFIPVKNPDGVVGLYDLVKGEFYANAGSGSFTAGPEVDYKYDDKESVINLSKSDNTTITLYAQWTPITYTNTVSHWAWGLKPGDGSGYNNTGVYLGGETFTAKFEDAYTLTAESIGIDRNGDGKRPDPPNGYKISGYVNTPWLSDDNSTWKHHYFPVTVTQKAANMSFQIDYEPITYNITYVVGEGANHPDNPSTYNVLYGFTLKDPVAPKGYTFSGWFIGTTEVEGVNVGCDASFSSADDMYAKLADRTTGDLVIKAMWTPITYYVAYDGNGATSGEMDPDLHTYDIEKALSPNRFSYEVTASFDGNGGTPPLTSVDAPRPFTGWNSLADGKGTSYTDKQVVKNLTDVPNATVTMYAQWDPAKVVLPEAPVRDGYLFTGWYPEPEGGKPAGQPGDTVTITEDETFFAQWLRIPTVYYYADGELMHQEEAVPLQPYSVSSEGIAACTRESCDRLDGFYTDEGYSTRYVDGTVIGEEDLYLYSRNEATVYFDITKTSDIIGRTIYTNGSLEVETSISALLPDPVKTYYGMTIAVPEVEPAWFEDARRARCATPSVGAYVDEYANGTPLTSARVLGTTTLYYDWRVAGYDGILTS